MTSGSPPPLWRTHLTASDGAVDGLYHLNVRNELIALIPEPPRLVIDIGCAGGATGARIKQLHPGARVIGLETHRGAAQAASKLLDQVIVESIESIDLKDFRVEPGSVDAVIAGDVLEHMVNPWQVLDRLRPFLSPRGAVVASVPNVRNLALVGELVDGGDWRYDASGLLDITHLRFFTVASLHRLFEESGYEVTGVGFNFDPRLTGLLEQASSVEVPSLQSGRFMIQGVTPRELEEFCAWQILAVAQPR
jgi:O-antigen biosynthesis protein